ncbi:MAG: NAD(P)/FAD-dependent oxidoreductase [Rhodospirillales bacterium]|nr:NAD(P)/FAD-dependent oxidoreductase [Rhodospirillales bacterium]
MKYDVTIIGGGVIGCAIARELAQYRLRVILLDKECEVGFGTSKSNSGIIHAGHHSSTDMLKGRLEWDGNQKWDTLCEQLGFGFERIGELTVAFTEEQRETLGDLLKQGGEKGVPGLEIWEPERIRAEEPALSHDILGALHAPTAGVINPYEACFALVESARANGVEIAVNFAVESLSPNDDGWSVRGGGREVNSQFVINAAGVYADRVAEMAGVGTFQIHPRKGEEYLLDKRLRGMVKKVIFPVPTATSKGILVIPTFDGTLMVGPTAHETEDREDITTSMAGSDEVFENVQKVVPGISERDCIAEFAGLRAVADGEDFIIGPTAAKGFINVAGIQSPGLTAAPAIAEMVADILADEGLRLDEDDGFNPTIPLPVRFSALPMEEQVRLAEEDSRYGHIVCRCEHVSERETVDSIHRGAHTLDGIKFRTRAGMGRCQGGFCTWRCMELLSQELGVPITEITKRGGGSWVVLPRDDGGGS